MLLRPALHVALLRLTLRLLVAPGGSAVSPMLVQLVDISATEQPSAPASIAAATSTTAGSLADTLSLAGASVGSGVLSTSALLSSPGTPEACLTALCEAWAMHAYSPAPSQSNTSASAAAALAGAVGAGAEAGVGAVAEVADLVPSFVGAALTAASVTGLAPAASSAPQPSRSNTDHSRSKSGGISSGALTYLSPSSPAHAVFAPALSTPLNVRDPWWGDPAAPSSVAVASARQLGRCPLEAFLGHLLLPVNRPVRSALLAAERAHAAATSAELGARVMPLARRLSPKSKEGYTSLCSVLAPAAAMAEAGVSVTLPAPATTAASATLEPGRGHVPRGFAAAPTGALRLLQLSVPQPRPPAALAQRAAAFAQHTAAALADRAVVLAPRAGLSARETVPLTRGLVSLGALRGGGQYGSVYEAVYVPYTDPYTALGCHDEDGSTQASRVASMGHTHGAPMVPSPMAVAVKRVDVALEPGEPSTMPLAIAEVAALTRLAGLEGACAVVDVGFVRSKAHARGRGRGIPGPKGAAMGAHGDGGARRGKHLSGGPRGTSGTSGGESHESPSERGREHVRGRERGGWDGASSGGSGAAPSDEEETDEEDAHASESVVRGSVYIAMELHSASAATLRTKLLTAQRAASAAAAASTTASAASAVPGAPGAPAAAAPVLRRACSYCSDILPTAQETQRLLDAGTALSPQHLLTVVEVARSVATTVAEMHRRGVVHNDIKVENVLLSACSTSHHHGSPHGSIIVDFGSASVATLAIPLLQTFTTALRGVGISAAATPPVAVHSPRGTEILQAPEVLLLSHTRADGNPEPTATQASDVWAMGELLFVLVTGRTLFDEQSYYWKVDQALRAAKSDEAGRERLPAGVCSAVGHVLPIVDALAGILVVDPLKRPDMDGVLEVLARCGRTLQAEHRD